MLSSFSCMPHYPIGWFTRADISRIWDSMVSAITIRKSFLFLLIIVGFRLSLITKSKRFYKSSIQWGIMSQ